MQPRLQHAVLCILHGQERVVVAVVYLALGAGVLLRDRRRLGKLLRDGFLTSYTRMTEGP